MTTNTQPIEKQDLISPLAVHSIFYTIQGEGPFTGHPAVFIRLAGCNLQCPGCDTDYTSSRANLSPSRILSEVRHALPHGANAPLVVITGGEPFRQNIAPLVRKLLSSGYKVQIETNGTLFIEDVPWWDITVVCSPKTGKINPKLLPFISAFKYVAKWDDIDPADGLPVRALDHTCAPRLARPPVRDVRRVYLQPMDHGATSPLDNAMNLRACVESCMEHGHILQLQIHKLINVE